MFCSNCGKEIQDGSAFCNNCGAVQNSTNAQPSAPQPTAAKKRSKAKLICGIILVFLCVCLIFDAIVFKTGVLAELFKGDFSVQNIIKLIIFIGFGGSGAFLIVKSK